MKTTALLLAALLALPAPRFVFADQDDNTESHEALRGFLRSRGEGNVEVRTDRHGVPAFLRGEGAPLARANDRSRDAHLRALMNFMRGNQSLFRLRDPGIELELEGILTDADGRVHYRFQQLLNGVPIRGAELLAHFNGRDLEVINGSTEPTAEDLETTPAVSEAEALSIAGAQFEGSVVELETPELEIREVEGEQLLTYSVTSFVNGFNRWMTVIDAHSGDVVMHFADIRDTHVKASGTDALGQTRTFTAWAEYSRYHMVDVTVPVLTYNEDPLRRRSDYGDTYVYDLLNTEGDSIEIPKSSALNSGWDPSGVSALVHAQAAYRYFYENHGKAGVDNRHNLLIGIHYGDGYDNAYWSGKWMVFGDGGSTFSNPAACADIVAHELTHGVIELTADLLYENQSGALNESFADVFAVLVENRNWKIGEDCVKPSPGWLRNLADTSDALRWQPEHMSEYVKLDNTKDGDWGGVHVNSGIPNRAAWLLMEGLSAEGIGTSIGREKAGRLYFRALSVYLTPAAQFIDLRRAMLQSAQDLYPGDASVLTAIRAAFDEVGIVEGDILSEQAEPGALALSASRIDFGDVAVQQRKTMTLRLQNTGEQPVTVHGVTVDDEAFTHSFTSGVLAPGDTLEGTVTVQPDLAGTLAATLSVEHDVAGSPALVELVATGVTPVTSDSGNNNGNTPAPAPSPEPPAETSSGGGAGLWLLPLLFSMFRRRKMKP